MPKKLDIQARILIKVEDLILRGYLRPFEITQRVKEISDDHVAKTYINAVESMWSEKNSQTRVDRLKIIKKAEFFEKERLNDVDKTENENAKVGFLRLAFESLKFQAKIMGLESIQEQNVQPQRLSPELLEKLDRMYEMNSRGSHDS